MQRIVKLFIGANTSRILIVKAHLYSLDWLFSGNDVMAKICEMQTRCVQFDVCMRRCSKLAVNPMKSSGYYHYHVL